MKNKKGQIQLFIWGGAALAAAIGYLINASKPAPTGVAGFFASIPLWGWITGILLLLIILKSR